MNSIHILPVTAFSAILLIIFAYGLYRINKLINELKGYQKGQTIFFENLHTAALLIDASNGRIVDANSAAIRFYGYKREELQNMGIDRINTLDRAEIMRKMQASVKNEYTTKHLFRHKLANGTIRDVEVLSGPTIFSGKQLLYSIVYDITDRKTEEMLQGVRNEVAMLCLGSADLQELLDKSVVIIHGIDGIIGCSICTFNEGKNLLEIRAGTSISKENREKLYSKLMIGKLTEISYQGKPQYYENIDQANELLKPFAQVGIKSLGIIPVKRNDIIVGTLNVASSSLIEFPAETKRALQSIAYSIGIAYLRLNSEVRKDEAEDRWRFALEENGDIIVDVDYVSRKAYVSEYLKQILGWTERCEIDVMKEWESLIHKDDLPLLQKAIEEHKQGKQDKVLVELRIITQDCQYKWFLFRAKIIRQDDNKKPLRLIAVLTEVTHLKNYELELLRSKQEVEASNKVKDLFLANISHELRTPMNGIMGITQLMELSAVSEEQQDNIAILKNSSNRMMLLINNLISLTSMEAEGIELNEDSFVLQSLVLKVLSDYEKDARSKGIELTADIDKGLPIEMIGDSGKLSFIIKQLVDNGIKFTNRGFVKVSAELLSKDTEGKVIRVRISVTDTGTGIKSEDITKLFGHFAQLDGSYTRKYQGAGLGLAICKKLADALGAEMEVESTPGMGSIFTVISSFKQETTVPVESKPRKTSGNVLIADDDEVSRRLLGILCEKNSLKVKYATNGREAVEMCMANNFDLVFMDIQMPEISGIEAASLIRSLEFEEGERPYIIAVTAYALKSDRNRFLSEGFDDYISKPVDTVELIALAKKWIAQRNENRNII